MYAAKPTERPTGGKFLGYDHLHFWVGNALQSAAFYCCRFGFDYYAYKGLETGCRDVATHVIKNKQGVLFAFSSPYRNDRHDMHKHQQLHGDGVRDVAFRVEDSRAVYEKAISRGAVSVLAPQELKDEHGFVVMSSVQTYGDTIHTFVQRDSYNGFFLPGFVMHPKSEPMNKYFTGFNVEVIDHVVGNQAVGDMDPTANWYEKHLDFHRFWSIDDTLIHTEYSSLNSVVVSDFDENIKMPINEPAHGKKISQIQEYVDYYSGPGIQHIALRTSDIITEVETLKTRGIDFLNIPDFYYDNLRKNIPNMTIKIKEDIDVLQRNKILVDYDDKGYLLQIFTKPVEDRPTLFLEIIQRNNHHGFGAGNFRALFTSIEDEQAKRGNLIDDINYVPK